MDSSDIQRSLMDNHPTVVDIWANPSISDGFRGILMVLPAAGMQLKLFRLSNSGPNNSILADRREKYPF